MNRSNHIRVATDDPWATPVYKDDGGEFVDFTNTLLRELLGKIYLTNFKAGKALSFL